MQAALQDNPQQLFTGVAAKKQLQVSVQPSLSVGISPFK
jgi:hypothetical protein